MRSLYIFHVFHCFSHDFPLFSTISVDVHVSDPSTEGLKRVELQEHELRLTAPMALASDPQQVALETFQDAKALGPSPGASASRCHARAVHNELWLQTHLEKQAGGPKGL